MLKSTLEGLASLRRLPDRVWPLRDWHAMQTIGRGVLEVARAVSTQLPGLKTILASPLLQDCAIDSRVAADKAPAVICRV